MRRLFLLMICLLLPVLALAQPGAKAYAPENLEQLSINDRIRVLNKEYSDLSGGQRLQRDQLEFYLDQIEESGWTFTEIRDDMQTSLGAEPDYGGPGYSPGTTPGFVDTIECTSRDNRYQECPSNLRFPRLIEQLSSAACIEGQSWGTRGGLIWVNRGCRARFVEGTPPVVVRGRTIECSSRGQRREECPTQSRWPMRLQRQLSSSSCVEGVSWGNGRGFLWVSRGCRGLFEEAVGGGFPGAGFPGSGVGGNVQLTCESTGGLRICPWDTRAGRPQLLREYSRGYCVQGRTWGVDQRGLWVNGGCAALFGIR